MPLLFTRLLVACCFASAAATGESPQLRDTAPTDFVAGEVAGSAFQLRGPAGYSSKQQYPLLIWLHGGGDDGTDNRKPLANAPTSFKNDALQARCPTFVYIPQCPPGLTWNSQPTQNMLFDTIRHLKAVYPIDHRRIYLAGFSMGGSGSYFVAQAWFEATGTPFAAVVRCAGQSEYPDHTHATLARSSVWIHIGLKDTEKRVALARDSYLRLRTQHYPDPADAERNQTVESIHITTGGVTVTGKMTSLNKNNVVIARISEYDDIGHSVPDFAFGEPITADWLFAQNTGASAKGKGH